MKIERRRREKNSTPGNPYSKRPKPTIAVTGAITMGLMNLQVIFIKNKHCNSVENM